MVQKKEKAVSGKALEGRAHHQSAKAARSPGGAGKRILILLQTFWCWQPYAIFYMQFSCRATALEVVCPSFGTTRYAKLYANN